MQIVHIEAIGYSNAIYYVAKSLLSLFVCLERSRSTFEPLKITFEENQSTDLNELSLSSIERILKIESYEELIHDCEFKTLINTNLEKDGGFQHNIFEEEITGSHDYIHIFVKESERVIDSILYKFFREILSLDPKNDLYYNETQDVPLVGNVDIQYCGEFLLLSKLLRDAKSPIFNDFNIFEIDKRMKRFYIYKDSKKIASITHTNYFFRDSSLTIQFIEEVKRVDLSIFRMQYENGYLIDADVCWSKGFDTENCIEKTLDLNLKDFGLKTFVFEIVYNLTMILDGLEVSYDLEILDSRSRARIFDGD